MKDLEISTGEYHDLWMFETGSGFILCTEDETDFVKTQLSKAQAEQIYDWLKELLKK